MPDKRVLSPTSDPFDLAAELFLSAKTPNGHAETVKRIFANI